MSRRSSLSVSRTNSISAPFGGVASSAAHSKVQVDVTFDSPVVFAGQSLAAIITFRNTDTPVSPPLATSLNEDEADSANTATPASAPSTADPSSSLPDLTLPLHSTSSLPQTLPIHNGAALHVKSPLATSGPVAAPELRLPEEPDEKSIEQLRIDEVSTVPTTPTHKQTDSNSWDMPGRRISSQIASTFRDFYFNNNSSSPDMAPPSTVSSNTTTPPPSGSPSRGLLAPPRQLQRAGSQRVTSSRPRPSMHSTNASFSGTTPAVPLQSLLMGYAQVQGYFVVDEELIDVDEFTHVKTQGVVVNKSGGIGYGAAQGGGLLQGLASGLGSLFQIRDTTANNTQDSVSSQDILGRTLSRSHGGSSSALHRGSANGGAMGSSVSLITGTAGKDNAIPIFSTPQSLLFVDLKLGPGESKSFYYKLELPKSLPPSCRAKSIRIHYNLVIGTQKLASSSPRPQPKTTFVPFRVFPYVDRYGQQYTHDLKTPIVLQKDLALVVQIPAALRRRIAHLSASNSESRASIASYIATIEAKAQTSVGPPDTPETRRDDFEKYVADMLTEINTGVRPLDVPESPVTPLFSTNGGIGSGALPLSSNGTHNASAAASAQDNIDYFTRSQQTQTRPLKTRFDIGRSGKRIAAVTFSKAVYRVGENIIFKIDFSSAALKCFHVTASLETEETITSAVLKQFKDQHNESNDTPAYDSSGTAGLPAVDTTCLTRRIYSQATMTTYSMAKTAFEFTIPATATPQFSTSAIALKWVLKLDFVTSPSSAPPLEFAPPAQTPQRGPSAIPSRLLSVPTDAAPRVSMDGEALNATVPSLTEQEAEEVLQQQPRRVANDGSTAHRHHHTQQHTTLDPLDLPDDPHSPLEIVHFNSKGLIAVAKETIACESFNCKIPLYVIPTNQDITALLQHSISNTRSWSL